VTYAGPIKSGIGVGDSLKPHDNPVPAHVLWKKKSTSSEEDCTPTMVKKGKPLKNALQQPP
jgi:hypothetical protein